ncbi:hypothetical protein HK105_207467 [Polyrhizophydium stewartii]|uniref:Pre-mRNA-splicing factor 38 n=1 Tax=Polyrhizophydium stewartii TaxID=2732419 RepID=A0ABR4N0G5_9FUNG
MGDYERRAVHGTNPQLLIEKILRERIYESVYWKERLFASSAETLVDRAVELTSIGGQFGNQRPTEFVCLALKLLQLQPEDEIIDLFLNDGDFKYLTALAAFYVRLTAKDVDVYRRLEPLLLDKRKLRRRTPAGSFELTFMDQFVDELLTADRACDTILPRLARRSVLEDRGDLEPRVSPIEDELDELEGSEEGEVGDADDAGSGTGTGNVGSGAAKASSCGGTERVSRSRDDRGESDRSPGRSQRARDRSRSRSRSRERGSRDRGHRDDVRDRDRYRDSGRRDRRERDDSPDRRRRRDDDDDRRDRDRHRDGDRRRDGDRGRDGDRDREHGRHGDRSRDRYPRDRRDRSRSRSRPRSETPSPPRSGPASGAADDTASKKRGAWSRKKVDSLFKKPAGGSKSDRRGEHADSSGSGGGGGAGGGAGDSLSVEETNRIRASLGLAPLKM